MAKNRWNSHRNSVKPLMGEVRTGISQHFNQKGHSISHMQFLVIEEVRSKNPFVLNARESYLIQTYGAVAIIRYSKLYLKLGSVIYD